MRRRGDGARVCPVRPRTRLLSHMLDALMGNRNDAEHEDGEWVSKPVKSKRRMSWKNPDNMRFLPHQSQSAILEGCTHSCSSQRLDQGQARSSQPRSDDPIEQERSGQLDAASAWGFSETLIRACAAEGARPSGRRPLPCQSGDASVKRCALTGGVQDLSCTAPTTSILAPQQNDRLRSLGQALEALGSPRPQLLEAAPKIETLQV